MLHHLLINTVNHFEYRFVRLWDIIKYPLFSISLRTLLDKKKNSHQFILFCVLFPFLSNALSFVLLDTVHKQHIFFLSPSNCLDSCRLGNGTALSIGPELNTLWGLRRFWVRWLWINTSRLLQFKWPWFSHYKHNFQRVFFFYLDSEMKVEIDWLSDWMQVITMRICNRDPVHLEQ